MSPFKLDLFLNNKLSIDNIPPFTSIPFIPMKKCMLFYPSSETGSSEIETVIISIKIFFSPFSLPKTTSRYLGS
jgi:hypothetical protein